MKRTALFVFGGVLLLAFMQTIYYYPRLPEQVASHYDLRGNPDRWSAKSSLILFNLFLLGFFAVIFLSLRPVLPTILWYGTATVVFFMAVMQMVYSANAGGDAHLSMSIWFFLILYLLFVIGWVIQTVRKISSSNPDQTLSTKTE